MAWSDMADSALQVVRNVLGTSGTYTPAGGTAFPITGVYAEPFTGVDPNTGLEVQSSVPSFTVRGADLTQEPGKGDTVLINGVTYSVLEAKPDGEGGITLLLND